MNLTKTANKNGIVANVKVDKDIDKMCWQFIVYL